MIWSLIERYDIKEGHIYRLRILSLILVFLIKSLTSDKKNFLYRIFDAIADCMHKEGQMNKLYEVGIADIRLQYLQEIMSKAHQNKTITNFLKDMLKILLQNTHEAYLKRMFGDYRNFIKTTTDEQLRE